MSDAFSNLNSEIKKMEKSELISKYRNSLMGIAILWIVLFHSDINVGKIGFLSTFLSFIKTTGYLGVDIFFFVSGFGLMAGWYKKRPEILYFYKRRFLRIMPVYWVFLTIQLFLLNLSGNLWNWNTILIYFTGLSIFINRLFIGGTREIHWFISALLLCYLIFPLYANYFQKTNNKMRYFFAVISFFIIMAIIITILAIIYLKSVGFLLIIILRLPAFFMGTFIGYIFIKKDIGFLYLFSIYFNTLFTLVCFLALAIVLFYANSEDLWSYGLYWYPFVLGSFSLTYLLSTSVNILHKFFELPLVFLDLIGRCSLELYFIHLLIFDYIIKIQFVFNQFGILLEGNYLWIVAIFIAIILSTLFNLLFQRTGIYHAQTFNLRLER